MGVKREEEERQKFLGRISEKEKIEKPLFTLEKSEKGVVFRPIMKAPAKGEKILIRILIIAAVTAIIITIWLFFHKYL